jgi:hypothetical protein
VGRLDYMDIFQRKHWFKFAFYWNNEKQILSNWSEHNEVDDEQ